MSQIGKGWFDLNETNYETYEFSKLKNLLTIIKYHMQDSILILSKNSLNKLIDSINLRNATNTICYSTIEVENLYKSIENNLYTKNPIPLFVIEIVIDT